MVTTDDLFVRRVELAMEVANIYDRDDIADVEPISYEDRASGMRLWTVWMFGNKKIYSVTLAVKEGDGDGVEDLVAHQFCDVYRFKNIVSITYDTLGCVIKMNQGKAVELRSNIVESQGAFTNFGKALVSLWDEYDN